MTEYGTDTQDINASSTLHPAADDCIGLLKKNRELITYIRAKTDR